MGFQLETHREWLRALVIHLLPHVNCHGNEITCSCRVIVYVIVLYSLCMLSCISVIFDYLRIVARIKGIIGAGGRIFVRNAKNCRIE